MLAFCKGLLLGDCTSGTGITGLSQYVMMSVIVTRSPRKLTDVDPVNRLFGHGSLHLLCQLASHVLPTAMNRYAIHICVRPGKIEVFKNVGGVGLLLCHLAKLDVAPFLNKNGLAR